MDLTILTLTKLKALVYDALVIEETAQGQRNQLNAEIKRRQTGGEVVTEGINRLDAVIDAAQGE